MSLAEVSDEVRMSLQSPDTQEVVAGIRRSSLILACLMLPDYEVQDHADRAVWRACRDSSADAEPFTRLVEFVALQSELDQNWTLLLINALVKLQEHHLDKPMVNAMCCGLEVLQTLVLIHRDSKRLCAADLVMTTLLDLLNPDYDEVIMFSVLHTLICVLTDSSENLRVFESLSGISTVAYLLQRKDVSDNVKLKVTEFFYFYLYPESLFPSNQGGGNAAGLAWMRDSAYKEKILGKVVKNVGMLRENLHRFQPFGRLP